MPHCDRLDRIASHERPCQMTSRVRASVRSSSLDTLLVDAESDVHQDGKFKAQMDTALINAG
jgi:hypothetical protein